MHGPTFIILLGPPNTFLATVAVAAAAAAAATAATTPAATAATAAAVAVAAAATAVVATSDGGTTGSSSCSSVPVSYFLPDKPNTVADRTAGRSRGDRAWVELALDVKVTLAPPCVLHYGFSIQNEQGGMKMTLTSTPRLNPTRSTLEGSLRPATEPRSVSVLLPRRSLQVRIGLNPIVTLGKQLLNIIGNLV